MNINGLFNPENRFWLFMDKIMNLCVISLLWFLCSIPVITVGTSTTALFQYTLKMTENEEGYVGKTFFKSFKQNFVQSTVLWIGMLLTGGFLMADLYICRFLPISDVCKWVVRVILASLLFVYFLTLIYVFPLLSYFKVTLKNAVIHSFVMALGNLYSSVTILVIYGVFVLITWFIPVLFMVWFVLASYTASHLICAVFKKYMKIEE